MYSPVFLSWPTTSGSPPVLSISLSDHSFSALASSFAWTLAHLRPLWRFMFFSKRSFNALSSSSRCFGDNSFLLFFVLFIVWTAATRVNQFGESATSLVNNSPERGCVEDQPAATSESELRRTSHGRLGLQCCCDWLSARSRSITVSTLHTHPEPRTAPRPCFRIEHQTRLRRIVLDADQLVSIHLTRVLPLSLYPLSLRGYGSKFATKLNERVGN